MDYFYKFLFVLFSVFPLLFPRSFSSYFYIYFIVGAFFVFSNKERIAASGFLQSTFLATYPALIILSSLFHWYALSLLPDLSYISLDVATNVDGMHSVVNEAVRFLSFPFFYLLLIALLGKLEKPFEIIQFLPFLFLPSVCVGIYQDLLDYSFFNSHAIWEYSSGINYDASAYGVLFLPFILIILYNVIIFRKNPGLFVLNLLYLLVLCYALLLRGQKTTILGVGVFVIAYPLIWMIISKNRSRTGIKYILILYSLVALLFIAIVEGKERGLVPDIKGFKQIHSIYTQTVEDGYEGFVASIAATRIGLWRISGHIIAETPWAGYGPGGNWRVMKNFEAKYKAPKTSKDSSGNHYLHMVTEMGFIGLIFGITPFLFCFYRKNYIFNEFQLAFLSTIVLVILFSLISGPHMTSPDVAFIFSVFPALLVVGSDEKRLPTRYRNILVFVVLCVFCIFAYNTYQNSIGKRGYSSMRNSVWFPLMLKSSYGFYNWENWNGMPVRWMKKEGGFIHEVQEPYVHFTLTFPPHIARDEPGNLQLDFFVNGEHVDRIKSRANEQKTCVYYLPHTVGRKVNFSFSVNQTFNPAKHSISKDNRDLGVAVSDFEFSATISEETRNTLFFDNENKDSIKNNTLGGCM